MAFLVAIEGIDGSGKGTQAERLRLRLRTSGVRAELISFPRYDATLFGKAVGDFLNGRFGTLDEVNPFLVSMLYAGDRFESRKFLLDALQNNDVVILDRYVASNLAHQGSKLEGRQRSELIDWIQRIEYEIYSLPRLDLCILLDLPAQTAQQLIATKQLRSYTDKAADLQEADSSYLEKVRNVYLDLSREESGWHRLDCLDGDRIRSIDEIAEEIYSLVQKHRSGDES